MRKHGEREKRMNRWEEKMAVEFDVEKLPVRAIRTSEYRRERHMKTRSLQSLSILFSSRSPSS